MRRIFVSIVVGAVLALLAGGARAGSLIRYEGSPAIGKFIEIANQVYGKSTFLSNVVSKSKGGEECVFKGACDIGGVANDLKPSIKEKGARATLIGWDAVIVIVNRANPVDVLSLDQLQAVFSGKVTNWKELGGADLPIEVLVTSPISATHDLFKRVVMKDAGFNAKVMEPDPTILLYVSRNKAAIGITSFFLLETQPGTVKSVRPDGKEVRAADHTYPLSRPLYLVTAGNPRSDVEEFLTWTVSEEGQSYLESYFLGLK